MVLTFNPLRALLLVVFGVLVIAGTLYHFGSADDASPLGEMWSDRYESPNLHWIGLPLDAAEEDDVAQPWYAQIEAQIRDGYERRLHVVPNAPALYDAMSALPEDVAPEVITAISNAYQAVEAHLGHPVTRTALRFPGLVSGDSAGLAIGLFLLEIEKGPFFASDLIVTVTGTLEADGRVGPVGRVQEKALRASHGDTVIFMVPRGQAQEIDVSVLPRPMIIIEVASLTEASNALLALPVSGG